MDIKSLRRKFFHSIFFNLEIGIFIFSLSALAVHLQSLKAETAQEGAALSMSSAVSSAQQGAGAQMLFEEKISDFGSIKQGERVSRKFNFKNVGDKDLVIYQMKTTCGCTAAAASTGPYRAGEQGNIEVNYDSRGKFGSVIKEVQIVSNERGSPQTITLQGIVLADQHPSQTAGDVLFKNSCADCHALPAKGKVGEALYDAVCYLCHDFPQKNGKKWLAPDRNSLAQISRSKLKRLISEGVSHTSMPAFGEHAGGPLSKEQVDSLVEYLIVLKQK